MADSEYFKQQAKQCRSIAAGIDNGSDKRALLQLARHYDTQAAQTEKPRMVSRH